MLTWNQIVERGKQHNKTVICEVDKGGRSRHRYFLIKCNKCGLKRQTDIATFCECSRCVHNLRIEEKKIDFILKSKTKNGDKFDYSFIEYINNYKKVKIKCNTCNKVFHQSPEIHLESYGCICNKRQFYKEKFIKSCQEKHGNKFNYDLIQYDSMKTKIKIQCNQCNNIFEQRPSSHLSDSRGCPYCAVIGKTHSLEEFCNLAKKRHEAKYDYCFVEYVNSVTNIKILCKSCNNIFVQRPSSHLSGKGCPGCKSSESKGENRVAKYLSEKNIKFIKNKTFKTLKDKRYLKPDFYLSELNLFIEYDGEGHYFPCFGYTPEERQKNFEDGQRRDKIKNEWAKANNIPLLRIPYWDFDRIEELIEAFILQHSKKKEIKQLVLEM
jgi:hypothetical protein